MFVLYDILNDYSREHVPGKFQYGDLAHAKKRAVKNNDGQSISWLKQKGSNVWQGYNKHSEIINAIFKETNSIKNKNVTGIYTVNLRQYSIDGYEVHADGGKMLTLHVDTAAKAKRIAKNIWNKNMSEKEALHLEEYGSNPVHPRPSGKAPYSHKGYEIWNMGGRHWSYRKPRSNNYVGEFVTVKAAMNAIDKLRNPKMKTNPERITASWIKKRVGLLNDMLDRPTEAYTKKADGGLTGNRGHLFIDSAYGGVKVAEMAGNGTGENNISDGYVSKRELNNFINGMIAGVREAQAGRKQNPTHKKTPGYSAGFKLGKGKKKTAKKNPFIKQGMQLPHGRGRVMQYDSATDYVLVDRGVGIHPFVVWTIDPVSLATYTGNYFKNLGDAVRKFEEKTNIYPNPKGRKKMAKKKRSAKQLANDKRLGRMAKARAAKKRFQSGVKKGGRVIQKHFEKKRKTNSKRVVKRNPSPAGAKNNMWVVFKVSNRGVLYLGNPITGQSMFRLSKTDAVLMQSKASGQAIARAAARKMTTKGSVIGTTKYSTRESEILDAFKGK